MLSVSVKGVQVEALVDTGASISVIHADLCSRLGKVKTPYVGPCLRGANAHDVKPAAHCTVRVFIGGIRHHIQCAVLSPCDHELILGWDFLSSASAVISCRHPAIRIADTEHLSCQDSPQHFLKLNADRVLGAGSEEILSVVSEEITEGDVVAVPAARFLPHEMAIATCLIRLANGSAALAAVNTTNEPILLHRGTTITSVVDSNPDYVVSGGTQASTEFLFASLPDLSALATTVSSELTPHQTKLLLDVLAKHYTSFDVHAPGLTQTTAAEHRIETEGPTVIRRRPYRVSSSEREVIEENVADMLKKKSYSTFDEFVVFAHCSGSEKGWFREVLC